MKEQVRANETNRREILKLSGMGVLGGLATGALAPSKVQAADPPIAVSYASWIHGRTLQIEYPDRIAAEDRIGWCAWVEGKPGTTNWFHFAIPTPVIINDVRLQIDSVLLIFKTGSIDAVVRDVHVYDGARRIAVFDLVNLTGDQPLVRLVLPGAPAVGQGLGISVGVGFGVEAMDHTMEFYSVGCDFVNRPVVAPPAP